MKKNMFYGAVLLMVAGVIAKILGAIYRVPLISLIGTSGIGLFQLIFPIYALFLVVACNGVPLGLSKIISVEIGSFKYENAKKIFKDCLKFMFLVGFIIAVFLCLFSKIFAMLQGCKDAYICYFSLAPAILLSCLISVFKGYFQGFQNMMPSAIYQVIEQFFKLIFSLLFAKLLINKGVVYGVFGSLLGITISQFLSLIYFIITYFQSKHKKQIEGDCVNKDCTFKNNVKKLLVNSVPIMLNSAIIPLTCAVESLTIVWLLSKSGIGSEIAIRIYGLEDGIVGSLINMPIVVATSISTVLVPNLALSFSKNNVNEIINKCNISIKYVWLISLPCAILFLCCADRIVYFLYSSSLNNSNIDQFIITANLLKFSAINIIYISILNMITAILQACNKSFVPVRNLFIASILKILLNFVFVTNTTFNIYGLVVTDIICFSVACVLDLKFLKSMINFNLNFIKEICVPLFAGSVMVLLTNIFNLLISGIFQAKVVTIIIICSCLICYTSILFAFKVFTKEELSFLPKIHFKQKSTENK